LQIEVNEIARRVEGRVCGDGARVVTGIQALDAAKESDISFFADVRYADALAHTRAGAVIVREETAGFEGPQVIVANPQVAYAKVASLFQRPLPRHPGVSPEACIHSSAQIGPGASIHPLVFVGEGAVVGEDAVLFPGVYVGARARIGARTVLHPNVSVLHDCIVGNDVIVHAGTVIGSDGFGYVRDGGHSVKIPQIGIVQIDDQVEIGANNCIDRAALGRTWIRQGVKTDNLVQIAHNVVIGEGSLVVAQAGISGSVKIGRGVVLGGQVGIADHLEIGDGARVASQSGVMRSIEPGEAVNGSPAMPHRQFMRMAALTARLPQLNERVKKLEKMIEALAPFVKERT